MSDRTSEQTEQTEKQRRSFAEWLNFSIAIAIIMVLIALVIYSWRSREDKPPILSLTVAENIRESQGQFYVPFTVTNTGGTAVQSAQVIGELRVARTVEETGEQQIAFLAGGESASGAFIFTRNPAEGEVVIRVASYKLP